MKLKTRLCIIDLKFINEDVFKYLCYKDDIDIKCFSSNFSFECKNSSL